MNLNPEQTCFYLVALIIVQVVLYDAWAWHHWGDSRGTVSAVMGLWCKKWPIIPAILGALLAHVAGWGSNQ